MIWKGYGGKWLWPNLRYYPWFYLEVVRKIWKCCHIACLQVKFWTCNLLDKAGMLTTLAQSSVIMLRTHEDFLHILCRSLWCGAWHRSIFFSFLCITDFLVKDTNCGYYYYYLFPSWCSFIFLGSRLSLKHKEQSFSCHMFFKKISLRTKSLYLKLSSSCWNMYLMEK